jgi:hypothetical protein
VRLSAAKAVSVLYRGEPENLDGPVVRSASESPLKAIASVPLADVVVEDADVSKWELNISLLGFLQEETELVHVLCHLTVIEPTTCSCPDLQFTNDCKICQSRHACRVTRGSPAAMNIVREVHARLSQNDGIQFDLTARHQMLPG